MEWLKMEHQLIKIKSRNFNRADVNPIIYKKRNEMLSVNTLCGDGYLLSIRRMQGNCIGHFSKHGSGTIQSH